MKKRIYLAGKITNNPNYYIEFLKAEVDVRLRYPNAVVLNPARTIARIDGLMHEEYMELCKVMLKFSDTGALLPNWKDSNGAIEEMKYAEKLGKKIIYLK